MNTKKHLLVCCSTLIIVLTTACAEGDYHEVVNDLYFEAVGEIQAGNLDAASGIADTLTADYPAEPVGIFLDGFIKYHREGFDAASPIFDAFDTLAYDRFVRHYEDLEGEQSLTALITKDAAVRLANLCVEEGRLSEHQRFSILAHDIEVMRNQRDR